MAEEQSTPALSKEAEKVLEAVKKMSLMEVADLVKAMEKEFGVSATAPVAMAMPTGGGAVASAEAEEKTSFDVELTSAGAQKIGVIKVVKDLTALGLKEAKDIVDGAPKVVLAGAKKEVAEDAKKKLEAAGATVTLK